MSDKSANKKRQVGLFTAVSMAVANMVGTGIFTSLGYQVADIRSYFALLALWIIGGIIALCGALTYGELGAALPRSGGEYHLLSKIYHPSMGFLAGWVALTAGFSAPIALAGIALGKYVQVVYPAVPVSHLAAAAIVLITLVHLVSVKWGKYLHNGSTIIKIVAIVVFIIIGFFIPQKQPVTLMPTVEDWQVLITPFFAVALVYVSYAYTGWNAAIYVVDEIKNPQKNLPKALFLATVLVTILYALLNYVFLLAVPLEELAGKLEVGFLAAQHMMGPSAANILSLIIAVLMISTISAMVFVGSRVGQVMGKDYRILRLLSKRGKSYSPVNAMIFQSGLSLVFIYTSTFDQVLTFATFLLILMNTLAVAGVYVLRWRQPDLDRPYKTWGYPVTPAIFLVVNIFIMTYVVVKRPMDSLISFLIVVLGIVLYILNSRFTSFASDTVYSK